MEFETLLVEISEGIATLSINRPKALNALNAQVLGELQCAFAGLESNAEVGCVILTGTGEKAFVAGADISAMQALDPVSARTFALMGQKVFAAIENFPKPVIAAVNGFALGGGCELAMTCDLRIASETARFGQPEVSLGVIPGFGGTQRLPRLVGKGRAMELTLTGDMIDAQEACRIGLVNKVVPQAELLATARKTASKILSKGQVAVRLGKEAIHTGLELDLSKACSYEADLFGLCFATADQKEGMQAFIEKRPAQFKGC